MGLQDFNMRLSMKTQRISYLHSMGRISNEEYEKWLLSEDINFEPVIIPAEEVKERIMKMMGGQSIQFMESNESKQLKVLEKIEQQLKVATDILADIRKK